MKIDLSKIKGHKCRNIDIDYEENLDMIEANNNTYKLDGPIHVSGNITSNLEDVFLKLFIKGKLIVQCDRCLENFIYKFDISLEESLSSFDKNYFEDNLQDKLNLSKAIKESIMLSLPMKFVCSEECKGLYYHCENNQSHESCNCQHIDPRLEALKKLSH
ncbi:DUF177 domain-containing protein [Aceticella autotrophica]|uniref:DUF177 domain-containing protein n=1 Tax=Aceticella autotrophica TaxID=2755338 RepID=A0A975G9X3_9THEO|nr:DUF177 domain-containing protein [Aceticella autotrophica]QSZ26652.1 DUF177 domain-containing protein [Aceticella autotrophica]